MMLDAADAAWFVLEISVRALGAAAAVGLILRVLRVRAATVLHLAWTAVLAAMLLMPVLLSLVPTLPVPVPAPVGDFLSAAPGTEHPWPGLAGYSRPTTEPLQTATSVDAPATGRPAHLAVSGTRPHLARPWLALVLLAIYASGVLLFVARLSYGWLLAVAMIRRAKRNGPIRSERAADVYESAEVTVPMTVGAIRPVIVLPVTWKTWASDTLAAVLAHEAAHVRRRDAAINLAAHVNRAIFWFHPLAWWLARKLAILAEHACDEAGARAIGAPERYAEILADMADVVRRKGGRLAWHAVGVSGAGLLDRRINRLLRADALVRASRGKTICAAIGCVLGIAAAIACRQQVAVTPLREDPQLAKRLAEQAEGSKRFEAARDMTEQQADALEQRLARNPEDFDARRQLVTYYRASSKVTWEKKVPGLRRHAVWLIEHHPEHDIPAPPLSPEFDPAGFAAAKKLWEAHLAKPDASPFLVYRAAAFFAAHDKPYAEQLILRGMAIDPASAGLKARMPPDVRGYEWPVQLAAVYAAALRGSEAVSGTYNDLRTHLDRVDSRYAMDVRKKLDATTDAHLLARVGSVLVRTDRSTKDQTLKQAEERLAALGVRYLERALDLDPGLESAKATLVSIRLPLRMTDADRLANRAHERYSIAEDVTEYFNKDMAAGKQQRDEAQTQAEEVLKMAASHPRDPAYSAAVMTAHHVLALAALRNGDRERAVHHLRESVKVPTSEHIQYAPPMSWIRPVNRLLKEGERERVAEFLEAFAPLTIVARERLQDDAQAIRQGRMPSSYQHMIAREGY